MGLQARLMSQALRKLTGTIGKTMTTVIFINQIRMKIGSSSAIRKPPPAATP
jgi:recombination protein RecA